MIAFFQTIREAILIDGSFQSFLKKGLSGTVLLEGVTRLLLLVTTLLLTNYLHTEEYGQYAYYTSWIITGATIGTFGLDDLIVRDLASSTQSSSVWPKVGAAIVIALIVAVVSFFLLVSVSYAWYVSCLIFLLTCQLMLSSILQGHHHVLSAQLPEKLFRPGIFLIGVLVVFFGSEGLTLISVFQALLTAGCLSLGLTAVRLYQKEGWSGIERTGRFSILDKRVLTFGALTILGVLRHKLDVLFLGSMDLLVETGIYNVGSKLADLMLVGGVLVNAVYMPLFAGEKDRTNNDQLRRILKSSLWINVLLGGSILIVLIIFGPWLLQFFGLEYEAAYRPMLVLSGWNWIYALVGPYIIMLMMIGFEKYVLVALLVGVLIQLVLAYFMEPMMPIEGMAWAKGISIVITQVILLWVAKNKIGLTPIFVK